jgi:hypothetical protein
MARPKSSTGGLADLFLTIYNSRKISNLTKQNSQIGVSIDSQFGHLDSKMDLIFQSFNHTTEAMIQSNMVMAQGTITGLVTLTSEVQRLSEQTWDVLAALNEMDRKEEVLGTLRLFLIEIEEEIDRINLLSESFPEFSFAILDEVHNLFVENDVSIEKFKRMSSVDDIKWAKNVIRNFEQLHHESLVSRATDEALSSSHELLIETVNSINELEKEKISLIPEILISEDRDLSIEKIIEEDEILNELKQMIANFSAEEKSLLEKAQSLELRYNEKIENVSIPPHLQKYCESNPGASEQIIRTERSKLKKEYEQKKSDLVHGPNGRLVAQFNDNEQKIQTRLGQLEDEYNFSMSEMTEAKEELRKNSPKIERKNKEIEKLWSMISGMIPEQRISSSSMIKLSKSITDNL